VARTRPAAPPTPRRPRPRARCLGGRDNPAAAVLAALSVDPAGAAVAVITTRAGISVPATRQALLAHEKKGTATRVKGSRPGIADTWQPAAPAAPPAEGQITEAPGAGSTADSGQLVLADGSAETGEAEASTTQEPDRRERRGHRPGRRRGQRGPRRRGSACYPGHPDFSGGLLGFVAFVDRLHLRLDVAARDRDRMRQHAERLPRKRP
jgi:hypothetical protein